MAGDIQQCFSAREKNLKVALPTKPARFLKPAGLLSTLETQEAGTSISERIRNSGSTRVDDLTTSEGQANRVDDITTSQGQANRVDDLTTSQGQAKRR